MTNTITGDDGVTRLSAGAPGSPINVLQRYPELLAEVNALYGQGASFAEAYGLVTAGVGTGIDRMSLLELSAFGPEASATRPDDAYGRYNALTNIAYVVAFVRLWLNSFVIRKAHLDAPQLSADYIADHVLHLDWMKVRTSVEPTLEDYRLAGDILPAVIAPTYTLHHTATWAHLVTTTVRICRTAAALAPLPQ